MKAYNNIFISLLVLLFFQSPLQAREKVVLVGGLNEYKIGQCYNKPCDDLKYLKKSHKLGDSLKSLDFSTTDVSEFGWSGDPISHNEGGSSLKNKFESWFYDKICSRGEICNLSIVAHSWGTIIASDFIASLPTNTHINIRTIVTYGSPVTGAQIKYNVAPFWETAIKKVKNMGGEWINVVNEGDVVAWNIPGVSNYKANGLISYKSRLKELFPVSGSEFDPKYIGTSILRQCNPFSNCEVLKSTIGLFWEESGFTTSSVPKTQKELSSYFYKTHFTESYEAKRLIGYIKSNIPNLNSSKPYFDGTGSLVDPQHYSSPKGCDGCERDYVALHSHGNQSSAGFFQVLRVPNVCESVSLEYLGNASVEVRSWSGRGTNSKFYKVNDYLNVVPLIPNSGWSLIAFKTDNPLPIGSVKKVKATCLSSSNSNSTEVSGAPLKFDHNNYWGGNGSLINHSNSQYNEDTQAGYGRKKDTVVLLTNKKTLSVFQVSTHNGKCKKIKFETPVTFNLSWKFWDDKEWEGSKNISDGDYFTFPTDKHWWILKIKAPAISSTGERIDAICQ